IFTRLFLMKERNHFGRSKDFVRAGAILSAVTGNKSYRSYVPYKSSVPNSLTPPEDQDDDEHGTRESRAYRLKSKRILSRAALIREAAVRRLRHSRGIA